MAKREARKVGEAASEKKSVWSETNDGLKRFHPAVATPFNRYVSGPTTYHKEALAVGFGQQSSPLSVLLMTQNFLTVII